MEELPSPKFQSHETVDPAVETSVKSTELPFITHLISELKFADSED